MGEKLSKKQNDRSPSHDTKPYQNVLRAYAKWEHHSALVTHDISRFANQEIRNLKKHNQLSPNSSNRQNIIQPSTTKQHRPVQSQPSSTKMPRSNSNLHGKPLTLQKSRSFNQGSNSTNIITAEQLIKSQSQRRRRYESSLPQNEMLPKSSPAIDAKRSNSSKNKAKQIPLDLQLVLINQYNLQNAQEIGKGNFGTVYRALYKGTRDVALKTLNPPRRDGPHGLKSSIEEYDNNMYELLHEAHIMTCLQHQNLLRIIGVTFFGPDKQLCLVTDFMTNGSLLDYLRKHREIFMQSDSKDITLKLNSFTRQIFDAMLYLEERSIIHRDLAARNCLIGDEDILKVGDFGLTKLTECGLYKGTYRTICALRWSSPEAVFSSKYTSRSDVWSYGITLWEIYSLSERPYGNLTNREIRMILKNTSEPLGRYFPQSQQFGSDELYTHIILPCLTYNVTLRPRFRDLTERVVKIFNDQIQ